MLGQEVLLPATLIAAPPVEIQPFVPYNVRFQNNLREAHQRVRNALGASARTMKNYFDRRIKAQAFTVGQSLDVLAQTSNPAAKEKANTNVDWPLGH